MEEKNKKTLDKLAYVEERYQKVKQDHNEFHSLKDKVNSNVASHHYQTTKELS